MKRIMIIMASP